MSFKSDTKRLLKDIHYQLQHHDPLIQEFKLELLRLRKQNEMLMDRLMAVDFEKYRTFAPEDFESQGPSFGSRAELNIDDDELAGEMVREI